MVSVIKHAGSLKIKSLHPMLKPGDEIREGSIAKELSKGRTFVYGNERKSLRRRI